MPAKKTTDQPEKTPQAPQLSRYFFPELGVSVEAESYDAALKLATKQAKN